MRAYWNPYEGLTVPCLPWISIVEIEIQSLTTVFYLLITGGECLLETLNECLLEKAYQRDSSVTMSTNAADNTSDAITDESARRYAELNIGDDEFVIYDRENHDAWIQSSMALDVAELR